jgi:hypothetical protein
VKVLTEAVAHQLRNTEGCQITAHLLIPGFTFTGITGRIEKPPEAWSAEQVIEFMVVDGMSKGDFHILCSDNAVTRETDEKRIRWAADDLIKNRPALVALASRLQGRLRPVHEGVAVLARLPSLARLAETAEGSYRGRGRSGHEH